MTLTLKAAPADSPLAALLRPDAAAAKPGASRPSRSERLRVLVVDDHPVNREVLVRQLDLLGLAADSVNDGVEALEAWAAGRYTAVLADIHMPRMDGYELTRRIRAAEAEGRKSGRTPVVAVTANAMKGEEERCIAAGMDAYLVKPVSIERLRATLERWLSVETRRQRTRPRRRQRAARARSTAACWAPGLATISAAIDSLLGKFRDTAVRDPARDRQRLAHRQSRGARRRRPQAQGRGATPSAPRASAPPPPRSSRPARPATARAAATGSGRSLPNCAARWRRSTRRGRNSAQTSRPLQSFGGTNM